MQIKAVPKIERRFWKHAGARPILLPAILLILFMGLIGIPKCPANEVLWVTSEGTAAATSRNESQARNEAIEAAEQNAIVKALASEVTPRTLLVNLRLSGSILGIIPYGKVIEKKILQEGLDTPPNGNSTQAPSRYSVVIKAGVIEQIEESITTFYLDAKLNHSVFKDGDELEIRIRPNRSCNFAVFNILEDNKIIPLLPNAKYKKHHLTAHENYLFPGVEERAQGFKLRVHLPEKKAVATESIYIIALAQPHKLELKEADGQSGNNTDDQKALIQELIRKIASVPIENRAEALMQYEIRKKS